MEDKETEEDDFGSTIPNLERFYEQMAAKARLPTQVPGKGANSNWVLSLARSYRRLSKDKRSRGRLRELLRPDGQGGLAEAMESSGGPCKGLTLARPPSKIAEQPGWSSNTDDSGYEAGYETDADESELSEWEGGPARHGHKRKLDALVQLTMKLNVIAPGDEAMSDGGLVPEVGTILPPAKTQKALGTGPVGQRYSLSASAPDSSSAGALRQMSSGSASSFPAFAWPDAWRGLLAGAGAGSAASGASGTAASPSSGAAAGASSTSAGSTSGLPIYGKHQVWQHRPGPSFAASAAPSAGAVKAELVPSLFGSLSSSGCGGSSRGSLDKMRVTQGSASGVVPFVFGSCRSAASGPTGGGTSGSGGGGGDSRYSAGGPSEAEVAAGTSAAAAATACEPSGMDVGIAAAACEPTSMDVG